MKEWKGSYKRQQMFWVLGIYTKNLLEGSTPGEGGRGHHLASIVISEVADVVDRLHSRPFLLLCFLFC